MRTSEYYGIDVPELGDRADITVVSDAIVENEKNQSGKIENMKASISDTIITLTSEVRTKKLLKYYNGLAIQFISPVKASAGTTYKIKIDNLAEQPYNNKVDINIGDIVQAIYDSTGFVSASTPIPSNVVRDTRKVIAGNGLQDGGSLNNDVTLNIVSGIAGLVVNEDNITLELKDDYNDPSTEHAPTANALKKLYDLVQSGLGCPYKVGDIFLTTNATNPSTVWLGTTWQKIEGRMLKGTSGSGSSKQTGGSDTVTLKIENIPAHTHPAETAAHTHTQPAHNHGANRFNTKKGFVENSSWTVADTLAGGPLSAGGETTGSASPVTSIGSTGSGTAFSVLNAYYTVHMWLRTA